MQVQQLNSTLLNVRFLDCKNSFKYGEINAILLKMNFRRILRMIKEIYNFTQFEI